MGVGEQKSLNTTGLENVGASVSQQYESPRPVAGRNLPFLLL
jgi:hypothetical protein